MELGKNICELRKGRSITQEELAAELGVTAAAVSKWETGATLPDVLMVCAIADFFSVSVDELLGRDRELKKLVVLERGEDRKLIAELLKKHGFCAAYVDDPKEAGQQKRALDAFCVLHIGQSELREEDRKLVGTCNFADCNYDEPSDLPGNLDTILAMLEKYA